MKYSKGYYQNFLICPYCKNRLILHQQYLVCRYHKLGFLIYEHGVDFQKNNCKSFTIEEVGQMRSPY